MTTSGVRRARPIRTLVVVASARSICIELCRRRYEKSWTLGSGSRSSFQQADSRPCPWEGQTLGPSAPAAGQQPGFRLSPQAKHGPHAEHGAEGEHGEAGRPAL